jgi:hypothetical protein
LRGSLCDVGALWRVEVLTGMRENEEVSIDMSRTSRSLLVACMLTALAACGCGTDRSSSNLARADPPHLDPPPRARLAALHSRASALHVASALLLDVALPQQTRKVAKPPATVASKLGRDPDSEGWPHAVDLSEFWVSRERPSAMLAVLAANGPWKRSSYAYGGTAGRTEAWSEQLEVPTSDPLDGPRQVFVSVVTLGARRYAVRLDALAVWHERRLPSSLVPRGARWLQAAVLERGRPAGQAAKPGPGPTITTTSTATLDAVTNAVNALPLAEPGGREASCPAETTSPATVALTFRAAAGGPNLARVVLEAGDDCGRSGEAIAWITTARAGRTALTDHLDTAEPTGGESLAEHVEAALGDRLQLPRH